MKLIVHLTAASVSFEYELGDVAEDLAKLASGELARLTLCERPPEVQPGHPVRFEFRRGK